MQSELITTRRLTGVGCYHDACAAAHALELLGERWALLVIRELMLGPRRFSDLRTCLPMLSANVLTQRLRTLEAAGVVHRVKLPPPAASQVYELTEWGYQSEPIFMALGQWGARSPSHDPGLPITPTALMLSLRTMFAPERARHLHVKVVFVLRGERYAATVAQGEITAVRGDQAGADLILEGTPEAVAHALYAAPSLALHESTGLADVIGDRPAAEQFFTLFPLPPKEQWAEGSG